MSTNRATPRRVCHLPRRIRGGLIAASILASLGVVAASQPGVAAAATTRTAAWPAGWTNPFTGTPGGTLTVTANFGAYSLGCTNADQTHLYTYYLGDENNYRAHLGLDLAQTAGAPVRAIGEGRVIYSGQKWGAENGHVVLVQHRTADGTSFVVTYGHLASPVTGGTVTAGQQVGVIASGLPGGDHLHLGLRPGTGTTEQPTIRDARVSGYTCGLNGNAAGMVDPINYLTSRQSPADTPPVQSRTYGNPDVIARRTDGALFLYRGDGRYGWLSGGIQIGSGWSQFDSILSPGDFDKG